MAELYSRARKAWCMRKNAEQFIRAVLAQREKVIQQGLDAAAAPKPQTMMQQLGQMAAGAMGKSSRTLGGRGKRCT